MRWSWRRSVAVGVAVVVVVGLALGGVLAHQVLSPHVGPTPEHADAIVAFAGESARAERALQLAADGRAGTVVLSNGSHVRQTASLCGQQQPFEVLCPEPDPMDTRGEARMFTQLARDRGWTSIIAVTGSYHVERARLLLQQCDAPDVSFVDVPWHHVGLDVVRHEMGGLVQAHVLDRSC